MAANDRKSFNFQFKGWLTPDEVGLAPDVLEVIEAEDLLRHTDFDVKVEIAAPSEGTDERQVRSAVRGFLERHESRTHERAKKCYETVVQLWKEERDGEAGTGTDAFKRAETTVKALNSYVDNLLKTIPKEIRETIAKTLDISPDDLMTLTDADVEDVEITPGKFQNEEASGAKTFTAEQDEKLKKALEVKNKWLFCYVVWRNAANVRVVVERPKRRTKPVEVEQNGESMETSGAIIKTKGKVKRDGKSLEFEFLRRKARKEGGKLPPDPEKRIKDALLEQTGQTYDVTVLQVTEYSSEEAVDPNAPAKKTKDSDAKGSDKAGTSSSKPKGRGSLAAPKSRRG